ncbi:MAG: AAA family ATPase [Xanthomonadales bacterium]|nr:AAA family ATPase [Xanthomonadales bacterium]MBK7144901.1 AAA family ATPase [Xanthomonadales bacterium]
MATRRLPRTPESPQSMTIAGFKSISDPLRVDLGKLTVLAGANSAGKSSLIQPLLLLKQSLDAPFDPRTLRLDGPSVYFSRGSQIFSTGIPRKFSVALNYSNRSEELSFLMGDGDQLVPGPNRLTTGTREIVFDGTTSRESLRNFVAERFRGLPQQFSDIDIWRWRCGWTVGVNASEYEPGQQESLPRRLPLASCEGSFTRFLERLIHVPGLRGRPSRNYPLTAVGPGYAGPFDSYVASVVKSWQDLKDERLSELGKQLGSMGLSWKIRAERIDDVQVELKVGRLPHATQGGARDLVSIADVGIGVSQVLPVLVALLAAAPADTVFVEQPEIHLHPRAQRALATPLVDAALRGVNVIVETHSHLLLTELQHRVARGDFRDPSEVKFHWLSRDEQSGRSRIDTAELTGSGAYGEWPVDFDDVLAETQDAYIAAAHASLKAASTRR